MGTPSTSSNIYATLQQLVDLGAKERQLSGITPEERQSALDSASSQIDSYLYKVYKLPLLKYDTALSRACAIMAAWDLLSVRGFNPDTKQGELLERRYDGVIAWLDKISTGKVKPPWPDNANVDNYEPTRKARVLAPSQGGIGIEGGSYDADPLSGTASGSSCATRRVGTPGTPRQRGW